MGTHNANYAGPMPPQAVPLGSTLTFWQQMAMTPNVTMTALCWKGVIRCHSGKHADY